MKIIINTTNLKTGGAIQVASSFINELRSINQQNEYHVFLCPVLSKSFDTHCFPKNFIFYHFENPKALSFNDDVKKALSKAEIEINPDCVFSIFGPTFWNPKASHVCGFAYGLSIYFDMPFFSELSVFEKIKLKFKKSIHKFLLKKSVDVFHVETEDAKHRLIKYLSIDESAVHVISNTHHNVFNEKVNNEKLLPIKQPNEFWFITISSYYFHKNFEIFPKVIFELQKQRVKQFKFIVTLPDDIAENLFKGVEDSIINVGPVSIEKCPYLYDKADALFLPTLAECFSASYPEAMVMNKPILTTDLPFAHTICNDAALYFSPLDEKDIATKIIELSTNNLLQNSLIRKGKEQLKNFETASSRALKYLDICRQTSNKQ